MQYPTTFSDLRSSEIESAQSFYHPELDILRFFAFFAVFIHHALPQNATFYIDGGLGPTATQWLLAAKSAGAFGVDLFFALSAFLITELLRREYVNRGKFSLSNFYIRRALRIWPLYFTFLAAAVFVIPAILPDEKFGPTYVVSFALFFGNWICVTSGLPLSVASPLWSISVEEQFYLGWPLLLRVFGMNLIKQLAIGMLAVALTVRVLLAALGVEGAGVWCNTLARLDPIALGALLAFVLRGRTPSLNTGYRLLLCGLAVVSWLLVARYMSKDGPTSIISYAVSALASVSLLVGFLTTNSRFLYRPPFTWLVYLGRISYGLYVFHLFALTLMSKLLVIPVLQIQLNFERRLLFSFLLTVILAAVSYRWLEQPFLRLKKRFGYKAKGEEDARRDSPGGVGGGVGNFARAS
jgi:peptidoglycan/LPS O-acetylase OafA/YrhL